MKLIPSLIHLKCAFYLSQVSSINRIFIIMHFDFALLCGVIGVKAFDHFSIKQVFLCLQQEFENEALFLPLGRLSTHGAFRKRSSNPGNVKTPAFHFRVDEKHFEIGAFRKR